MVSARLEPGGPAMASSQPLDPDVIRTDLRAAYDRGRSDERASRRHHPIFMAVLFLAAACGAALLVLAATNGSFSDGGRVADDHLAAARASVTPAVQDTARQADRSLRDVGAAAKARVSGSSN